MAEDLGERTEEASGRRIFEARRKGQVARSANLSAVVILCAATLLIYLFADSLLRGGAVMMRRSLAGDLFGGDQTVDSLAPLVAFTGVEMGKILVPIMVLVALVAFVEQVMQVGWLISPEALRPKLSKFNPVQGVKRLFSTRTLVKTIMDSGKLALLTLISVVLIRREYDELLTLPLLSVPGAVVKSGEIILDVILWSLIILLVIGIADRMYQKFQHRRDLRMTKQEVKEERKDVDGDPLMKGRRMQRMREMHLQRLGIDVPRADVVVTNPTHFSVAIRYDSEAMSAPRVVAKGADYMAMRIRVIAAQHGVPIVERPALARALYHNVDIGQEIPADQFEAVAELLAYVYRLDGRMAS